ncbi:MAG TPA: cytochrome c family protein, partial [Chryseolinea sp.]
MKKSLVHIVLLLLMLSTLSGFGQLSPGDLSQAHAKLEGMSNCTQCHDLGKKVNNNKCLECHKEIKILIGQNKGYHASSEAKSKDCFSCHSEHHGRKFDMVRFDEKKFNHDLTKYKLEGAHATIECKECHRPDNIQDASIRKKKDTFLGL